MKKTLSILLAVALVLAGITPALANEGEATPMGGVSFSGKVDYQEAISILAPFGGRLEDYRVRAGDAVVQGDVLFTLCTTKVYAPADGVVRGVRATPGDDAQDIIERYGALAAIEPNGSFLVTANTSGAYKSTENGNTNRLLHMGEIVYLRSASTNDRTGIGYITSIEDSSYTVEVIQSNLQMDEKVNLFRDPAYKTDSRIGTNGTVKKNTSYTISAEGSVLRCHVADGDIVRRGDLLFQMVTGPLDGLEGGNNEITAPVGGVLIEIGQSVGANVAKGDVLATMYDQSALLVRADISESDLDMVGVGDRVKVSFDAVNLGAMDGTVAAISFISTSDSDEAVYSASILLPVTDGLRVGMSVSVYTQ